MGFLQGSTSCSVGIGYDNPSWYTPYKRQKNHKNTTSRYFQCHVFHHVSPCFTTEVYCGLSWLTVCSDVPENWEQHTGAFDPSMSTAPQTATNRRRSSMNYITLGGDGVEGDLPSADTVTGWMSSYLADNLDFDLEGSIQNDFSSTYSLLSQVKSSSSSTKGQATCLQSQYNTAAKYKDDLDYFGIMIHGSGMLSGGYTIPEDDPTTGTTWGDIQNWLDSDVPNEKIILSLTTVELTGWMVDWFKSLIAQYGLAGMSFWYWQGDDYQLDSSISIDCIQDWICGDMAWQCMGDVMGYNGIALYYTI